MFRLPNVRHGVNGLIAAIHISSHLFDIRQYSEVRARILRGSIETSKGI